MSPRRYAIAAYVVLGVAIGAVGPYLPIYYRSLGLDLGGIGVLGALSAAIGMLGAPLWGAAADRFAATRLVLPIACLLSAIAGSVLAQAGQAAVLFVIVPLYALATCGLGPVLDSRALETVAEDRNRWSRLRMWMSLSFIFGAIGVGALVERTMIGNLFLVLVPMLLLTGVVSFGLPSLVTVPALPRLAGIRAVLGQRQLATFLAAALVAWSASSAINAFFSIYLVQVGGADTLIGVAWALGAAVEIPIMLSFPWLSRRVGVSRLLLIGAALLAVRALVLVLVHDPVLVTLTFVLHGGGFGLLLVSGVVHVARLAPAGTAATSQGVLSAVTAGIAQIIGPGIAGVLAQHLALVGMFAVAGTVSAIAVVGLGWQLAVPARIFRRASA